MYRHDSIAVKAGGNEDMIKKNFKKYWFEIFLVSPLVLFIFLFNFIPIFKTILLGFQDRYTGAWSLSTYAYLFNRPNFVESISNTVLISIFSLAFQLTVGMCIALILRKNFRGNNIMRSFVLMPMGVPTLVSAVIALHIFGTSGYLNQLLLQLFNIKPRNWLDGGTKSLIIIALADTWKVLPMIVLLLLSGLESIPNTVYESAMMDGSNKIQTFFKITLPMVKSSVTMSVLFRAVSIFRIFELPQVLVGKSIPFVATYAYEEYSLGNVNASGAASTVLMLMILIFTILYLKFVDKGEGFGNE